MTAHTQRQPGVLVRARRKGRAVIGVAPALWIAAIAFFVVVPLVAVLARSLQHRDEGLGLANYAEVLSRPQIWEAMLNSLLLGLGSSVGCLAIAVPYAYLVSRTNLPMRGFFRSTAVLTFAAPGFVAAMGWILLLGPESGLINTYVLDPLGLPRFNVFSMPGILLCLVLFLYPLIFLPLVEALDTMDSRLEEAAQSVGASRLTVLRKVTLPLTTPALFSGTLLVFVSAFTIFGPVALLGSPVGIDSIPTAMFGLMSSPPRIEYSAVLGLPVVLVLALLLWVQHRIKNRRRYTTVTGKPGTAQRVDLGRMRWPMWCACLGVFVASIVLPFGVLVLTSFRRAVGEPLSWDNLVLWDNYAALLEQETVLRSFVNSIWIALVASLGAMALGYLAVWLRTRAGWRGAKVVQPLMLAPLAFPGAILGIAMLIAYSGGPMWLGGTLTIMVVAYMIRVIPQSFSYIDAGVEQINSETEEAARNLGAGWLQTVRRVSIPLIRGPLLAVGILNFVILFRELDISIFLYTGNNGVAPVILYNLAAESQFQVMGALSVVILAINLGVVIAATRLLRIRLSA
ncbi:iron ABC transporter permease [Janibacter sp. CX7]|uniref:ABC transporter permease n=1 Tax=Janibacter sp. CX7 TaxID=2963431 RepID=UPI0020CB7376|nr:iron ABC transporter permease [Janibacter sp. CX7]UTT66526.1 iron ABC transporter permease [Janibacter sp. CX7]